MMCTALIVSVDVARRVVMKYKTDELVTIIVDYFFLPTFTVTHCTVSFFPHPLYQPSLFAFFDFPFDPRLFSLLYHFLDDYSLWTSSGRTCHGREHRFRRLACSGHYA